MTPDSNTRLGSYCPHLCSLTICTSTASSNLPMVLGGTIGARESMTYCGARNETAFRPTSSFPFPHSISIGPLHPIASQHSGFGISIATANLQSCKINTVGLAVFRFDISSNAYARTSKQIILDNITSLLRVRGEVSLIDYSRTRQSLDNSNKGWFSFIIRADRVVQKY